MPFKEEMTIIRGFDQILTELAIFRTRKGTMAPGSAQRHKTQAKHMAWKVGQTSTRVFFAFHGCS